MRCCHADFTLGEGSDRGFTLGMPTFTFGQGVLAEAGEQARELGLARVALFTDRKLASGEHVAKVKSALAGAGIDVVVFDEVEIEPNDRSFQHASRFAGRCASRVLAAALPALPSIESGFSMRTSALSRMPWSRSRSTTVWPPWANTWAMPLPIVPAPSTPTLRPAMARPAPRPAPRRCRRPGKGSRPRA